MKEAIEDFISGVFTHEYIDSIHKAFSLFSAFGHENAYNEMHDAATDESVSSLEERSDRFTQALVKQLDFILKQHLIEVNSETRITDRIQMLDALYRIQHLEDYTTILKILDTEQDSIDQMAQILADLMSSDESIVLSLLKTVDDKALSLLQDFIESKTKIDSYKPINPELTERLRVFFETLGKENIGYILIDSGMMVGLPIELYVPYIEDQIVDSSSLEQTAVNLLSILYMADISETDMMNAYREIGERVFKSVDLVGRIEQHAIKMISKVQEARKISNEKARLFKESTHSGKSQ